jgi:shikimate kinase
MGSGKSSVGLALARQLGWPYLDLDEVIEKQEGRSIQEIFRSSGEPDFRRAERHALAQVLASSNEPSVVALGGGAFAQAENAELLRSVGATTVFLDAPAEILWQRCLDDPAERPLRQNFQKFAELYQKRRPLYLLSTWRIDSSTMTVAQIAEELARMLHAGKFPGQENLG